MKGTTRTPQTVRGLRFRAAFADINPVMSSGRLSPLLRVVLIEDVKEMRDVLRFTLELAEGFEIVGEAGNAASGLDVVAGQQPDAVVLDLGLPDVSGADIIGELRKAAPGMKIVVLSGLVQENRARLSDMAVDGIVSKSTGFVTRVVNVLEAACRSSAQG